MAKVFDHIIDIYCFVLQLFLIFLCFMCFHSLGVSFINMDNQTLESIVRFSFGFGTTLAYLTIGKAAINKYKDFYFKYQINNPNLIGVA